jgi:prophage antirepressor-like protein
MLTTAMKQDYAGRTIFVSGQPHPTAFAVFLRPKFHYGRDDRPKYKTFGEYASRLTTVVESRLPVTTGKVLQLNRKEVAMTALTFQNTQFDIIDRDGQPWLRLPQIGAALGYANQYNVQKIYSSNADEFTDSMTAIVELDTEGGKQQVRVFSLRGCHLLAMLSRTKIAKDFRKWVLDILDHHRDAQDPFLADNAYRVAAQEAYNAHWDKCHADMEKAGVKSPAWPKVDDKVITGVVASMMWRGRWIVSFDNNQRMQLSPMSDHDCVVDSCNPDRIKSFINCLDLEMLHHVTDAIFTRMSRQLARHKN